MNLALNHKSLAWLQLSKLNYRERSLFSPDPRAIRLLEELVNINSHSSCPQGIRQVQERVGRILQEMGFELNWIASKMNPALKLLDARRYVQEGGKEIVFVCHADTALPNDWKFHISKGGQYAHGSGVIDNKGGLVVGLRAIQEYLSCTKEPLNLRFLCSPNEEVGSVGFTDYYQSLATQSWLVLGLEPALEDGSIIHCRRGNRWYDISIKGHETHSGRSFGQHANAAHEWALQLTRLQRFNRPKKMVSINVGHIEGGKGPYNVICGSVKVKLDVRFASFKDRDRVHRVLDKLMSRHFERSNCGELMCQSSYQIVDDCPPFAANWNSLKLSRKYRAEVQQFEARKVASKISGGAGDVNYFSHPGALILDGLGPVGSGMHTQAESVEVSTLTSRAMALGSFLSTITQ